MGTPISYLMNSPWRKIFNMSDFAGHQNFYLINSYLFLLLLPVKFAILI